VRIDRLTLTNYKGFASRGFDLNPRFNLFVGDNASGKTSVLDALVVAIDSWFIGMKVGERAGGIDTDEVRVSSHPYDDSVTFEKQFPASVEAHGLVMGNLISWSRELNREGGRTTTVHAKDLAGIASETDKKVRAGEDVDLPLVCSYGTERLWWESRHHKKKGDEPSRLRPSRFDGYRDCTTFEIQETALLEWIEAEISISLQKKNDTNALAVMKQALVDCVEDAKTIYYDPRVKDLIVVMADGKPQMFRNLSDGQRVMLTMIGDLAKRAITLNPHMGRDVLRRIVGIVTIDELDLHLHPRWQRRVIHDLKRTFPRIQFVATTHSPQLIGEALPDEIRVLENWDVSNPEHSFGVDSSRILQEVMGVSPRNVETQKLLSDLAEVVDKEDLDAAKQLVAQIAATLGENDPEVTGAKSLISLLESTK
jgi:predicted ATP-binding protein involved in virulence